MPEPLEVKRPLGYSRHFGHKTVVNNVNIYEGWNQLDLFSADRNKEVEINVKYIQWKGRKKNRR